jgi:F-type H+-transporting ATPase subunit delta
VADRDTMVRGYAQALFAVAEAEGQLEQVEDELYRFGATLQHAGDLREALTDPGLPADRTKAVLLDLLGKKASPHTVGLLGFVIEQGRAKDLPRIVEALTQVAAERRRKTVAEVRVAVPLDEQRRARLIEAISKASGKDVELKVLVDPSIVGGVVARVGDQVFDGSIKRKLELARTQLAQAR